MTDPEPDLAKPLDASRAALVTVRRGFNDQFVLRDLRDVLSAASFSVDVQHDPGLRLTYSPTVVVVVNGWGDLMAAETISPLLAMIPTAPLLGIVTDETSLANLLDAGFADVARWPMEEGELGARIRARLRTSRASAVEVITMDPARLSVRCNRVHATLTPGEFRLLQVLLQSPGRWITSKSLLEQCLGTRRVGATRVAARVHEIRKKLQHEAWRLRGHRTLGYLFETGAPPR